jgi:nicotinate phosphoribosyltransferase
MDDVQTGEPLLRPVMRDGRHLGDSPRLETVQAYALEQLGRLPEPLGTLTPAPAYPVEITTQLMTLIQS